MREQDSRPLTDEREVADGQVSPDITSMLEMHERELAGATATLELPQSDKEILSRDSA